MNKPGDFVKETNGKHPVMLVELINDNRIIDYTNRTRSGGEQVFYTGNDERDWERYKAEGGTSKHGVEMHDKADTIRITHAERHLFALLVDGQWWWANGCAECCGRERGAWTYTECEKHDVCRSCHKPRAEFKESVWGGMNGWICNPCQAAEHEADKQAALAAMPEKYDEWDYYSLDEPKCPHCNQELVDHELHQAQGEEVTCHRCDNTYSVTAEVSVNYTMAKLANPEIMGVDNV